MTERQPISELYMRLVLYGLSVGVEKLCDIPGCWEHQINDQWFVAANGHKEDHTSKGFTVWPFHFVLFSNDMPIVIVNAYQGVICGGWATDFQQLEDEIITMLKELTPPEFHE